MSFTTYTDPTGKVIPVAKQGALNANTNQAITNSLYTTPLQFQHNGALTQTEGGFNFFGTNFGGTTSSTLSDLSNKNLGFLDTRWNAMTPEQQSLFLQNNPDFLTGLSKMSTAQEQQAMFSSALNKFDAGQAQGGAFSLQGMFGKDGWVGGASGAINAATSLYGAYLGHQNLKLQKQAFEEQRALNRANFKNTARQYNSSLRNQLSGRGYIGMSNSAKGALGQSYRNNKVEETY